MVRASLDHRVVANVGLDRLDLEHVRVAVNRLVLAVATLVLGNVGEALDVSNGDGQRDRERGEGTVECLRMLPRSQSTAKRSGLQARTRRSSCNRPTLCKGSAVLAQG